jgi:hypothetical protein
VFTSVPDLTQAITTWAERWNNNPTPFIWKATAEEIIIKVKRGRETLNQIKTQSDRQMPVVLRRTACARGSSMSGSWAP